MKSVMIAEAKATLSALVDDVRTTETAVQICKREKPVAILISPEEYDRLREREDTFRTLELRKALSGDQHDLRSVIEELQLA